ncbi:GP179 protein, partial [Formicarius rufipectus]|nr:GP179 protein [Formicarius rufipectus]
CPWEGDEAQLERGTAPGKDKHPPKEVTTSKPRDKGSKEASGKSQSVESLKAEICPWEVQELRSSERDDICPWEGAEAQLERGTAPGKERPPPKEASKPLEKSSKDRESICPWENMDTEDSSQKTAVGKEQSQK